eukprot:TRINITY_DN6895_c0_g1_i2.p1 TRINITY_DN6895_c0_g1~~TRINITY_DN6895_c0_g1_i2.p1  ORF type:complete len:136 (-),score=24.81 TRINITY_DN6895_c0_g1_i2:67-474(-)
MTSTITLPSIAQPQKVDREKVCPLLLRVFSKVGSHHHIEAYQVRGKEPTGDEMQIYTWKDATLREITELIKEISFPARQRNARLNFAFIYPDPRGRNILREVGSVHSQRIGPDDQKTLEQLKFETGDFLDVAILL